MAANLDGVHAGCALVDRVLSVVDPVLFNYLESKFLTANIYAFPLVMSLHACVPPLEEAVKLWDAVFSFGVHLEVLVCVAQVCVCVLGGFWLVGWSGWLVRGWVGGWLLGFSVAWFLVFDDWLIDWSVGWLIG